MVLTNDGSWIIGDQAGPAASSPGAIASPGRIEQGPWPKIPRRLIPRHFPARSNAPGGSSAIACRWARRGIWARPACPASAAAAYMPGPANPPLLLVARAPLHAGPCGYCAPPGAFALTLSGSAGCENGRNLGTTPPSTALLWRRRGNPQWSTHPWPANNYIFTSEIRFPRAIRTGLRRGILGRDSMPFLAEDRMPGGPAKNFGPSGNGGEFGGEGRPVPIRSGSGSSMGDNRHIAPRLANPRTFGNETGKVSLNTCHVLNFLPRSQSAHKIRPRRGTGTGAATRVIIFAG